MTPGPTLIFKCLVCEGLMSSSTIASGNTLGATVRSDGKINAPMLPRTPPLVACPHCSAPFQLLGAEPVEQYELALPFFGKAVKNDLHALKTAQDQYAAQSALATQYRSVPRFSEASLDQCLEWIQSSQLSADTALTAHLYTWHRINDKRALEHNRPFSPAEASCLRQLLALLPPDSDDAALLRAEAFRELGCFADAASTLRRPFTDHEAAQAEQLMQAIERGDTQPFSFASTDRDDDSEYLWSWMARQVASDSYDEPLEDDLDPPVFTISNRNWWVKVLGMCSHRWALIETQHAGSVQVYFFLDDDQPNGPSPYKRNQIKGRSAVLGSQSFETVQAATRFLIQEGYDDLELNPGPWVAYVPRGHFYDARQPGKGF